MQEQLNLVAPCGIYCGICPIYIADKGNHIHLKEVLAAEFKIAVNEIKCDGCLSDNPFVNCSTCAVRDCIIAKRIEGCYKCDDFPCSIIEEMPDAIGKQVILRSVPLLRKLGIERFIEEETKHYQCPYCGHQLFMGVKRCRNCNNAVNLQ